MSVTAFAPLLAVLLGRAVFRQPSGRFRFGLLGCKKRATRRPVYLVVNRHSYPYVRATVRWIIGELSDFLAPSEPLPPHDASRSVRAELSVQDEVLEREFPPGSLVFVIGDLFSPFAGQKHSTFVFVNFSLLYNLAPPGFSDQDALRWLDAKRRAMLARARSYDAVANFLPEQNAALAQELKQIDVKVYPFIVDVERPQREVQKDEKTQDWDLCIVGSRTVRRERFYDQLRGYGLTLSPWTSNDLGETMRRSRIVLNIHAYRTLNTEYPRVVEALTLGCCLVTEPCVGLDQFIPSKYYRCASLNAMPATIMALLGQPDLCRELGDTACQFMSKDYRRKSHGYWRRLMEEVY